MQTGRRAQRVERELQGLVANFLRKGFKYPLRGLVSVTRVETPEPLRVAHVFVSVLGSDEDREYSMETLHERIGDIQKHINKELRMKFVPKISIHLDRGFDHMDHVQNVLKGLDTQEE